MAPAGSLCVPWQWGQVTSDKLGFFMGDVISEPRTAFKFWNLRRTRSRHVSSAIFSTLVTSLGCWGSADLDPGLDEVARFQHERAGVDGSLGHAAGGDGQAAERLQVALEFSGQDNVLHHAQSSFQNDAGMNFENGVGWRRHERDFVATTIS